MMNCDSYGAETDSESVSTSYEKIINPDSCLVRNQVDGDKVKILLICPNEEQRLITFDISSPDCTVQDLLDEARIPISSSFVTYLVRDATIESNYVVTYASKASSISEKGSECSVSEQEVSQPSGIRYNLNQPEAEQGLLEDPGGEVLGKNQDMEYEYGLIEGLHTFLICKTVMIGSYYYTRQEKAVISTSGVRFRAPHLQDESNLVLLELKFGDILKVLVHFGDAMPVLFFWLDVNGADTVRQCLGMFDPEGPYYKPDGEVNKQRRITLLVNDIPEESKLVLRELFKTDNILEELTSQEATSLLLSVSPKEIRPQIKSLTKKCIKPVSTVRSTANSKVNRRLGKKPQDMSQTSHKTISRSDHAVKNEFQRPTKVSEVMRLKNDGTVDRKPEIVSKVPSGSLRRPRTPSTKSNNPVNEEIQTLLVYPPPPAKGGITITDQDLACLDESRFLNDVIIDFYLKYLSLEVLSEIDRNRTHIFSIHFYTRLTREHSPGTDSNEFVSPAARRHTQVRNWTKAINIFEKDFIIIPINKYAHWFLAIICFPGLVGRAQGNQIAADDRHMYKRRKAKEMKLQAVTTKNEREIKKSPCILIFDSLAGPSNSAQSVISTLRNYLSCEYLAKFGTEEIFSEETMKGLCPRVPQQNNFSDCGLFVLQYVESFFSNPITDYTSSITTLEHWFDEIVVIRKRKKLSNLLKRLMKS